MDFISKLLLTIALIVAAVLAAPRAPEAGNYFEGNIRLQKRNQLGIGKNDPRYRWPNNTLIYKFNAKIR